MIATKRTPISRRTSTPSMSTTKMSAPNLRKWKMPCWEMMHSRGQAKGPRMEEHAAARRQHRPEHVDKSGDRPANAGNAASDLVEHSGDGDRGRVGRRCGFHAADFVNETGIVLRQPGNL